MVMFWACLGITEVRSHVCQLLKYWSQKCIKPSYIYSVHQLKAVGGPNDLWFFEVYVMFVRNTRKTCHLFMSLSDLVNQHLIRIDRDIQKRLVTQWPINPFWPWIAYKESSMICFQYFLIISPVLRRSIQFSVVKNKEKSFLIEFYYFLALLICTHLKLAIIFESKFWVVVLIPKLTIWNVCITVTL